MRDFFIFWIIFQLIIIGQTNIELHNKIIDKTWDCSQRKIPTWWGIIIPLAVFVPKEQKVIDYCKDK